MKNLHVIVIKLQNYKNTRVLKPIPIFHKLQLPSSFCQFIVLLWLLMGKPIKIPLSLILLLTLSYIRAKAKLNVNLPILLIERRSSEDSIRRLCTAGHLPLNKLFYWLMRESSVCFNFTPNFTLMRCFHLRS